MGIHPFGKQSLSYYSEAAIWHPRLLAHHQTIWQASCLSVCLVQLLYRLLLHGKAIAK